jgi:hypothetical protein
METTPTVTNRLTGAWHAVRGYWNWKTALFSALGRAPIFFAVNLSAGLSAATAAFETEFIYRIVASGFYGALTEAFTRMTWRCASVAALVTLPTIAHTAEYFVHAWARTPELEKSIAASVVASIFSTAFSLFLMRRGIFLARGSKSFLADLRDLVALLFGRRRRRSRRARRTFRPLTLAFLRGDDA